ncbi:MAG: arabinogalactan endo-1,4-beta-galactosidase [Prevotella sp.]|nr:arabinogalactan endo-1,4-beta-galactosidase [Prevotella sp.]
MKFISTFLALFMATVAANAQKYIGGDISALTRNETFNPTFLDKNGNTVSDPLDIFKSEEMNIMRVRLFVKPSDYANNDPWACQDLEYVKELGKRIKDKGFKLMLDFHYSDTWADPAKQWTPKQWETLTDDQLYTKIYEYTKDALEQMKAAGAEPEFIQTGNEISYGMLWGKEGSSSLKKCFLGSSANWSRFTTLLKNAGKACREVCPSAKIIIHTERAAQTNVLTNFYDRMKSDNVDYDIIGLSYYPVWHNTIATLETAIKTLESRYADKNIMIVETGYGYSWEYKGDYNLYATYPATEAGQKQFTDELITMLNKHEKVNGLLWWWMDYNAYPWATTKMDDWWYAPLIDSNTGKPLAAMSSLKDFLQGSSSVGGITIEEEETRGPWYNAAGQPVGEKPTKPGLYFRKGKKLVVGKE